jgi:hypothetical protein
LPSITFAERELDLFESFMHIAYPPDLAKAGSEHPFAVLLSLDTNGVPSKLRRVDVRTGAVQKGGTIRGCLRDAWSGKDLWILTTYAVHRVSNADLSVEETLKVPHFLHRLVPLLSARFLALSQIERKRTSVLSPSDGTLKVVTMPTPDISIDHGESCTVLSFWAGEARGFDGDLKPTRERRELPLGLTPIWFGEEILFLRATREIARNVSPVQPDVKWLYPTGMLAVFNPAGWTISREARVGSLDALLGVDGDGRIIATDQPKHTVALIDPRTFGVVARYSFREQAFGIVQAGPFAVAYRPWSGHLRVIDWS